ncbi:hypothetical protein [uncultured Xylophilus sp.]|uniref:hypothetical protein n=1 Tax=uncultured Xylophilus sp. TaxID=296832 RepID=UPI0025F5CE73|nr:hypothetical protein [uncultured Xylophilus sp.]
MALTIKKNDLGSLFLPAERDERAAVQYLEAARQRTYGTRNFDAVCRAYIIVLNEHERTVELIRKRGGLLLIVDPVVPARKGRRA